MSISESRAQPGSRADVITGLVVVLTTLAVYWLTLDASIAGLSPPDAPARMLDDEKALEYLSRAAGIVPWPAVAALTTACATFMTFMNSRTLGASAIMSVAASLAFAFGRGTWAQAVLPGIESLLTLSAALAIACVLRWSRTGRVGWIGLAVVLIFAATGRPILNTKTAGQSLALWLFLELGAAAIALAIAGAVRLVNDRRRDVVSVAIAGLCLLALTPLRGASSPHSAVLPAVAAVWPLVAAGGSCLAAWLRRREWAPVIAAVVTLIPLSGNYRHVVSDTGTLSRWQLDQVASIRGCGVVLGQTRTVRVPDPERAGPIAPGCALYVLGDARGALEHAGYRFEPMRIPETSLGNFLRLSPRGTIVALAVPGPQRDRLRDLVDRAPLPVGPTPGLSRGETGAYAMLGIVGSPRELIETSARTAIAASDTGRYKQTPARAEADDRTSVVKVAGVDTVRSDIGSFIARTPTGEVLARQELGPDLHVAFDRGAVALSRLTTRLECATLAETQWTDVTELASQGRIGVRSSGDAPGSVLLYAARIQGLDPWLVTSWGRNAPGIEGRSFDRHDVSGNEALAAAAAADRLPVSRLGSFERVTRIAVSGGVPARGELLTSLDFSGIPALVVARASDAVAKSSICPAPRGDGYFSEQHVQHETVGGRRSTFGYGWGPVDREGVRLEQREGELLISLARPRAIDVVLTIVSDGAGATIGLAVNGSAIETRSLGADQGTYHWTIPAAAWKTGVNWAVVAAPPGLRVRAIDLVATDR